MYRFAYFIPERKDGRRLRGHQLRDGDAAVEVLNVLHGRGYEYGDVLLNYPAPLGTPTIPVDDSALRSGDLLLLTTRPPLHDEQWPLKRGMPRSHTSLEEKVFARLAPYFFECTRSCVYLAEPFVRTCPPRVAERSKIQFRQNGGASYLQYTNGPYCWTKPADERTTAAYKIFEPELWPGGPDLLVVFGMGGEETLGWARFLRRRAPELIMAHGFAMAEMVTTPPPAGAPSLGYMDEWPVELLVGGQPRPLNS